MSLMINMECTRRLSKPRLGANNRIQKLFLTVASHFDGLRAHFCINNTCALINNSKEGEPQLGVPSKKSLTCSQKAPHAH